MTKKDYELIASAFRYGFTIPNDGNQLDWVIALLAKKLQLQNPLFDLDKFLLACGVAEQQAARTAD